MACEAHEFGRSHSCSTLLATIETNADEAESEEAESEVYRNDMEILSQWSSAKTSVHLPSYNADRRQRCGT